MDVRSDAALEGAAAAWVEDASGDGEGGNDHDVVGVGVEVARQVHERGVGVV